MRIKYVANVRIPTPKAQGYAIIKMCSEFARLCEGVELFIPNRKNTEDIKKEPFDFYRTEKNFEIKRIPSFDFLGRTEKFGKISYWIDIFLFVCVAKFFVKIKENDILYTRDFFALLFFSKNKSIFLELHDIPKSGLIFKWLIKRPKGFIVLNDNLKKILVDSGISEGKILVSPSGVDISDFDINIKKEDARKSVGLPLDKKIVMYTGHLYPWKGTDVLAEAAKLMLENIFVFVGGVEPELSRFTKKYGNLKNIIIKPFQNRQIIPTYLKAADVLVIPNSAKTEISNKYTSPLKLFEYMASKRPIVVSDLPSMRQVLNQDNAFFTTPDDAHSLSKIITEVLSDQSSSDKKVAKAWSDVQRFSWTARAESIINFIKK